MQYIFVFIVSSLPLEMRFDMPSDVLISLVRFLLYSDYCFSTGKSAPCSDTCCDSLCRFSQ